MSSPEDTTGASGGADVDVRCCVPPLVDRTQRARALRDLLARETEPVATITELLRLCRDEHRVLVEHHGAADVRARAAEVVGPLAAELESAPMSAHGIIDAPIRAALETALTRASETTPTVVIAHALAERLDQQYHRSFRSWFAGRSPYQPSVGDPIPLDRPDLRDVSHLTPTSPPWRLANRLDETRHLRLAGEWATQFRVTFDYAHEAALTGLMTAETVVAVCQPNRDLTELGLPSEVGASAFPIAPRDRDEQGRHLDRQIAHAAAQGAQIVVIPELAVDVLGAHELEGWVRRPGPIRLLVAGTHHHRDGSSGRRSNRALAWVRGHPAPLRHDKHSPADRPVVEDINPAGWPELRVHVTADGWHVVLAVCRDLLNPAAVHALAEIGSNLVLVPAMTDTLVPFGGPVAQLVASSQAFVAVANNPVSFGAAASDRPGRALFGHPGFERQTRAVLSGDPRRGVATLHLGTGAIGWMPTENQEPKAPTARQPEPPLWAEVLRGSVDDPPAVASAATELRAAAVLALLSDGPTGVEVLLTRRSPDLSHFPGRFVFPGGAAEPGETPTETALREADEEIGLDRASILVLGALPSFVPATNDFLITPILAWSHSARLRHPPNPAEVTEVRRVAVDAERTDLPLGPVTDAIMDLLAGRLRRIRSTSGNHAWADEGAEHVLGHMRNGADHGSREAVRDVPSEEDNHMTGTSITVADEETTTPRAPTENAGVDRNSDPTTTELPPGSETRS